MAKKIEPRNEMPRQEPEARARNFDEVALGYTAEMAVAEAKRCMQCPKRPCVIGCPVMIQIPDFVKLMAEGKFLEAGEELKKATALPAVCGRVCPQEEQCEKMCVVGKIAEPVAVGRLERFAADYLAAEGNTDGAGANPDPKLKQYNIAIIGSGPSGLTAAGDLAKMGYSVTVFEALHKLGGVLRYGIPEFRLPREILDREIEYVKSLGVKFLSNVIIGKTITIDSLMSRGFDAIFVGSGAGAPQMMNIPGENLNGVLSGNEWLTRINLMRAFKFPDYTTPIKTPKRAAIIGGGNTAMDCARTALRVGAEEVNIVYRRSRAELPARAEEAENAEEEGINFQFLINPIRFIGDERGWLTGMECVRMELGEPDASGRRRPVPVPGSEFIMEVDTAIVAIGQTPNPLIRSTTEGLETTKWGGIVINEETGMTSIPGVFAGGDAVTGAATVITAMGAGKVAASGIDQYIREKYDIAEPQ